MTSLEGGEWCAVCPSFPYTHTLSATRSHFLSTDDIFDNALFKHILATKEQVQLRQKYEAYLSYLTG